jgi:EpsI family protein
MTTTPHVLLTVVILAAAFAVAILSDRRSPEVLVRPLDSISNKIDGWTSGGDQTLTDTIAATLDATAYLSRTYRKNRNELDLFAAFYARQRAGESMLFSPKHCLPGEGWEFSEFTTVPLTLPGGTVRIIRAVIQKQGSRALLFYWCQSCNGVVASEYQSKVFLVWDRFIHANPGRSIVRVMLQDRPGADEEGLAFAAQLMNRVQRCFRAG